MRTLVDEILDTHHSGPAIISEQHDVNQIDLGKSTADVMAARAAEIERLRNGGQWDAAEYGRSRAEQIARLEAANTPAKAAVALADLRQRAIQRAGLDTTGGRVRVMVAGKAAWHKLGVTVAEAVTSAQALRLAGLDWQVEKQPLSYRNPVTGEWVESAESFGVIRQDSGDLLGAVGSRYKPFQNADGFAMLDRVLGEFGARYEAAGSLYGGKRVFMLVRLPGQAFAVGAGDQVEAFALFTNPHDGSGVAECFATSERVVCANTLRVARNGQKSGIKLRHTGDLKARVRDAQQALNLTVQEFETFKETADTLTRVKVPSITEYANGVLDAVLEVTQAEAIKGADALAAALKVTEAERLLEAKRLEREIEKRRNVLEDILQRYESGTNGVNGMRGTAWSALNAVTESADHGRLGGRFVGTEQAKASRRFESMLTGEADEAKQVAYQRALTLAS
jgi:phage/plasmid-like protein (TIGR03299 family)